MHFQLFIPDRRGQDPQMLVDAGLADFVAGAEFMDARGPDDSHGTIIAWRRPGQVQMGYQPDRQTWLPAARRPADGLDAGRYWIGFWNDSPPGPRELGRPYLQIGHRVTLGDGQEWQLPVAKELAADLILADDGSWRFEIQRKYHAFYLEFRRWEELFLTADPDQTFLFSDAADFILQALRINYRITAETVAHLRLFSTDTLRAAILAVLNITPSVARP